jgi:hypothetical protein
MSIVPNIWTLPNRNNFQNWIKNTFNPNITSRNKFQFLLDIFNDLPINFIIKKQIETPKITKGEILTVFQLTQIQQLVANLLRKESPYRGILLYHALGSGKTCSAISIANTLLQEKDIIFISKASIEPNFIDEVKKCGLIYFRTINNWTWIPINKISNIKQYSHIPEETIKKNNGVFIVNPNNPSSNYDELSSGLQQLLHKQLEDSIRKRITFLHIDDTRLASKLQPNMFDNKIIIIDEVHNLTNNMTLSNSKRSAAIYQLLLNCKSSKIIMLSGTPIINNLFELSKLFNILYGNKPTLNIYITGKLNKKEEQKLKNDDWSMIKYTLEKNIHMDQIAIHKKLQWIQVSMVPPNFINVYQNKEYLGIQYSPETEISPSYQLEIPESDLKKLPNMDNFWKRFSLQICKTITNLGYKFQMIETMESCLPEDEKLFNHFFIEPETHKLLNKNLLMERILGLTSSYHYRDEELFPKLTKVSLVRVPMTNYQYELYTRYRKTELEKSSDKINYSKELDIKFSPAFRIRSRLCCTFAFPKQIGDPYSINKIELLENLESKLEETPVEIKTIKQQHQHHQQLGGVNPVIPPAKDATPPAKDATPPAKTANPPAKTANPPAKDATPPAKDANPPAKTANPPAKTANPPAKTANPPAKTANPPAKDATPLAKTANPPIKKIELKKSIKKQPPNLQIIKQTDEIMDVAKETQQLDNQIKSVFLELLEKNSSKYLSLNNGSLTTYGPKMAALITRLLTCAGTALIYSQFRTLIGLNVMALALKETGKYEPFKLVKSEGKWKIGNFDNWNSKIFHYVFYTGGENHEEREIYRHIFNNSFQQLSNPNCSELVKQLEILKINNMHGDIIKVLLTTKTGTEGLNLFGVRQVHILEPYWQHVLIEQVIGRAIRYKSHLHLPPEERNVEVFIYLTTLDDRYLLEDDDVMKGDIYPNPDPILKKTGILASSDEFLYILSQKKKQMISDCLELLSKSSIDCKINVHEPSIGCFNPKAIIDDYTTTPRITDKPDEVSINTSLANKLEHKRISILGDDDNPITYCPIPNKNGDIIYFINDVPSGIMRINRNGDYKVVY